MPCIYSMTLRLSFLFCLVLLKDYLTYILYTQQASSLNQLPYGLTTGPKPILFRIAKLIRMGYLAFNFSILALFWLLLLLHFSNQRSLSCGHTSAHHQQDQSKCVKPHDSSAFTVHCHPKTKNPKQQKQNKSLE